jgi:hypothetical protein
MPEPAEGRMADYYITYRIRREDGKSAPARISAARLAHDEQHRDMLVFKNSADQTVALLNRDAVIAVDRREPETARGRTEITET